MSAIPDIDETLMQTYRDLKSKGAFAGDFGDDPDPVPPPQDPVATEVPTDPVDVADPQDPAPVDPAETVDDDPNATDPQDLAENTDPAAAFRPKWKKAELEAFDRIPEADRKLIAAAAERRENDFHKGIEQYKTGAAASQEWERAVQPFMATIQSYGVTPQVAAQELFKADHLLRYSAMPQKVQMLLKVAGDYGVDLQTLANGIQQVAGEQVWQQQNPADPRLQALQDQVAQMQRQQFTTQQQVVAAEHSAIDGEIAAFAADPDHEHFQILQQDMAALLQAGRAKDLDEAYEMAMRANPQTYQIWLAQQQQGWDEQRRQKVALAKRAGANNVRPNGRASVAQGTPANETLEQTLERVAREQGLIN
ncbi:hypothetical protein [Burkholderia cepacia]|uniref:hypothetical protein n=1 Tax=Burkholderia cepacia TaxID=292 RepID=UPI001CF47693|nr:hypothetical protein [Burkholderia cepacia]MCA8026419.1 hypothetical protein [Burkholderia cepacia]